MMHPAIDLDAEAAECGLFSVPELLARKRGPELERFNARVAALVERGTLDLRASVGTCADPATLWALHMELMGRGIPPILRGPRPWHLGAQGRLVELAADLAWLSVTEPGHAARHGLARAILRTPWGSSRWCCGSLADPGMCAGLFWRWGWPSPSGYTCEHCEQLLGRGYSKGCTAKASGCWWASWKPRCGNAQTRAGAQTPARRPSGAPSFGVYIGCWGLGLLKPPGHGQRSAGRF